ncbi:MAG TPA: hypothetical protein VGR26_18905 [Acidimicrobiales bacterium]|nr:hypothetical protein [Acidimicrobiales bacterium]
MTRQRTLRTVISTDNIDHQEDTMARTTREGAIDRRGHGRERIAALSGAVFVALLVVHAAIQSSGVPSLQDPADEIVRYLADKNLEIQIGTYLQGLAMVAYLWFLGSLWRLLRPAEGGPGRLSVTAVAATGTSIALVGVHIAILTGLSLRADTGLDPEVASVLYLIAFVVLGMSSFANAALMGALGTLILRTMTLPRWLGHFGVGSAVLWLLAGVSATTDSDVWGAVGFLAFLVWLAWTATASIAVARLVGSVYPAADDDVLAGVAAGPAASQT